MFALQWIRSLLLYYMLWGTTGLRNKCGMLEFLACKTGILHAQHWC